ncbi:MAG TPA: VTT domain-containing protein [Dehalococcoidia bacterium]|nr:VTT domain-containing protein [Dehalococcoidia bacterium]
MTEEALQGPAHEEAIPEPPPKRIVLDMPSWLPTDKFPRKLLIVGLVFVLLSALLGTSVPVALGWVGEETFNRYGYAGIFAANFLGTATGFIPVPGLTAAGQALIIAGSDSLFVPGVVVAGASGMTLAESTAYLTGSIGRGLAEERQMPVKGRLGRVMHRMAGWVDWLMDRYGFMTLLVLSAIPNFLFEFAGITAGAVRMNFWRFLLAVAIGKTIRVIILVTAGKALLDAIVDWMG